MTDISGILPGARVRTDEGYIGSVERLARCEPATDGEPDCLLVRSDDGQWHYRIPLLLVRQVTQGTFYPLVRVALPARELTYYLAERGSAVGPAHSDAAPPPDPWARTDPWAQAEAQADPDAPTVAANTWRPDLPDADDVSTTDIPLAAEELVARKRPIPRGSVHLHKGIETVEQRFTVPVHHEEAVIEHIPADQYDGTPAGPDEIIIPIIEEHLTVQKQTVVREYVRVRKTLATRQYEVRGSVRREVLDVTRTPADDAADDVSPVTRQAPSALDRGTAEGTESPEPTPGAP